MTEKLDLTGKSHEDLARLSRALETLSNHRFVRIHNSIWLLMWYQFVRGLALGLGTVIGASALVSVVVLLLSQVEFVPILGSWATQIIEEIQQAN
ncbi:DUF5665 domain-containing protein [Pseudoprimorskyibacter insulae]|uniref:Uncharacterized protein n=1 Tax=Pseudoprimorskyibacter insulae TaxID=1695997 RepID=A0A2R8AVF3_9RHOB|nr:DUF5665 domain-containing protein [Pseudoprimorskyibacter insulae]SPF80002.1 hypothetical protein PRI8871_01804 [Pseudoprimorskyibacter insulae]